MILREKNTKQVQDWCCYLKPTKLNTENIKQILWRNIVSLMVVRYGKENMGRLARDAGIGAATVTRIKEMQTSVGTENLEAIANALGVPAWQLLNPEMKSPTAKPEL